MKTAKDIIKPREGLRLKAYQDSVGIWTIGWGHTSGVQPGWTCTEAQAGLWLDEDMAYAYGIVDKHVTVPLTTPQREALCSFVFNLGPGRKDVKDGFVTLKNGRTSTMLTKLNAGDYVGCAKQFDLWVNADGKRLNGLITRRKEEKALFLSGTNLSEPTFIDPEEKPMGIPSLVLPIATELLKELPAFGKIFTKADVSQRNLEAVSKATDIVVQAVGATNGQQALEMIKADPVVKEDANNAIKFETADVLDLLKESWDRDEKSVAAARESNQVDKAVWGQFHFVHILALVMVFFGAVLSIVVMVTSINESERAIILNTWLLVGVASVVYYFFGSSRSSQVKDIINKRQ